MLGHKFFVEVQTFRLTHNFCHPDHRKWGNFPKLAHFWLVFFYRYFLFSKVGTKQRSIGCIVALISGAWALALLAASPVMVHTHLKVAIGLMTYLGYSTGDWVGCWLIVRHLGFDIRPLDQIWVRLKLEILVYHNLGLSK